MNEVELRAAIHRLEARADEARGESDYVTVSVSDLLAALDAATAPAPAGLDEEHCCNDLSYMSAEYLAATRPAEDDPDD